MPLMFDMVSTCSSVHWKGPNAADAIVQQFYTRKNAKVTACVLSHHHPSFEYMYLPLTRVSIFYHTYTMYRTSRIPYSLNQTPLSNIVTAPPEVLNEIVAALE